MTKYISTPLVSDLDTILNKSNYDLISSKNEFGLMDDNFILVFRADSLLDICLYLQENSDD